MEVLLIKDWLNQKLRRDHQSEIVRKFQEYVFGNNVSKIKIEKLSDNQLKAIIQPTVSVQMIDLSFKILPSSDLGLI